MISNHVRPCAIDTALGAQVDEVLTCGVDCAVKLFLLSEAWQLCQHGMCDGTIEDYAAALCYPSEVIQKEFDQLVDVGYFTKALNDDLSLSYHLTGRAPKFQTVRRLLASWQDMRFHLRANAEFTFRYAPGNARHA
jgi:hypothetical protein